MNELEFKALVEKVGLETATKIKEAVEPINKKLAEIEAKGEMVSKADFDAIKELATKQEDVLKTQGIVLSEMQSKLNTKSIENNVAETFKTELETALKEGKIDNVIKGVDRGVSFTIKATPSIHAINPLAGNTATFGTTAFTQNQINHLVGDAQFMAASRNYAFILDFATVTPTMAALASYWVETPKDGDFAVTAEGNLKPLLQYHATAKVEEYKTVAGVLKVTKQMLEDFPRIWSQIVKVAQVDLNNKMNDNVLTGLIANAAPYALPALALQIDGADDYGAIGAAICQIQSNFKNPTVLCLNPADAWVMKLIKGSDGHYIMPPFMVKDKQFEFGAVICNPSIAAGNFLVGDGSTLQVLMKGDIELRYGLENDDIRRNQQTLVIERNYFDYLPASDTGAWVYGNFAAIKAAIEKP